jgi:hypothetical protein
MERYCSTGQSPQRAVAPTEEEEEDSSLIQINQPTICNNFSGLLLDVYLQLNMFRAFSLPLSGATTTAVAASGFTFGAW